MRKSLMKTNIRLRSGFDVLTLAVIVAAAPAILMAAPQNAAAIRRDQQQSGHPVSLAAFARQARAARARAPRAQRVFTNASLAHAGAISVAGTASAQKQTQETAAADKARANLRASWKKRFAQARAQLKLDQRELNVTQREFNLNQMQYYSNPNVALRQQYSRAQLHQQRQKILALKARVAADQARLDKLHRQLRRSGWPESWSR